MEGNRHSKSVKAVIQTAPLPVGWWCPNTASELLRMAADFLAGRAALPFPRQRQSPKMAKTENAGATPETQ